MFCSSKPFIFSNIRRYYQTHIFIQFTNYGRLEEFWVDSDLILYIEKKVKVDKDEALNLLQETKKFLMVAHNNYTPGKSFAPSAPVDQAWHNFILLTPVYSHFCKKILKRESIVPHIPNIGRWNQIPDDFKPGDINQSYVNTLIGIEDEIGEINEKYWPDPRVAGLECCTPCQFTEDDPKIGT